MLFSVSTVAFVALLVAIPFVRSTENYSVNGTNYFISYPMIKNWHQSQRYCAYHEMELLTINSPEENDVVMKIIEQFNPISPDIHFWTSGTNAGHTETEWYWLETGEPVLYTNWIGGHPNSNNRNCLMLHGGIHKFKWFDQSCHALYHFICQKRLTVPDCNEISNDISVFARASL